MLKTIAFIDLDGTLWRNGAVPESALRAIRIAQENGHLVLANTGRPRCGIRELAGVGVNGTCCAVGADIELGGDVLMRETLDVSFAQRVKGILDSMPGCNYLVEGGKQCFYRLSPERIRKYKETWGENPYFLTEEVSEMDEADWEDVYKFIVSGPGPTADELRAVLPPELVVSDLGHMREMSPAEHTKATAMEVVRKHVQAATGERWRTLAIGDSENDLTMLRGADVSACMGDGAEVARQAADFVTGTVEDDGLWRAFEHFGLV